MIEHPIGAEPAQPTGHGTQGNHKVILTVTMNHLANEFRAMPVPDTRISYNALKHFSCGVVHNCFSAVLKRLVCFEAAGHKDIREGFGAGAGSGGGGPTTAGFG